MTRSGPRLSACAVAFFTLAVGGPGVAAAGPPKPISGTLDKVGYTVLALADNGQTRSVVARDGRFSLVPPGATATLHLRAPDGTYAGPIVLGSKKVTVRRARAGLASATRNLVRADRSAAAARTLVRRARGGPARRRAARLLRRARRRLTRARRQLTQAKEVLADARQQATTLQQAEAGVVRAARMVRLASRELSAARRRARRARGGPARRRAASLLRRARLGLGKARRGRADARRLLAAKQREASQAIVGVKAGAPLGAVAIDSAAGYAVAGVDVRVRTTSVDATRTAQARSGVPIGAGNFGRVASNTLGGAARGDLDLDGVPEPLDLDDDGDLIIDTLDNSPVGGAARSAQAGGCGPGGIYCPGVSSILPLSLAQTVNVNAGSTIDQVNAALRSQGVLRFEVRPPDFPELDCGDPNTGLVYCRQNGSTATASAGAPGAPAFPGPAGGAFDPDGDGFGLLDPALEPLACGGACPSNFFLLHGAGIDQIGSGDVMLQHVTTGGNPGQSITTLAYVYATVPALVRHSDTAGHSAVLAYPVPEGAPGTGGNGFPVSPGPDGNILLTLTLWRPQRKAMAGSDPPETAFMDVGRLTYGVKVASASGGFCPQSAFSEDDPNLTPATPHLFLEGGGGFDDAKGDAVPVPGNSGPDQTFTYTLNLTQCLASRGIAFAVGDEVALEFIGAPGAPSVSSQVAFFKRET
jgi:hypothetical protein